MSGRLSGKIAIVTGGSRGIGEQIAEMFATEGAEVVISSRRQESLDAVAERINGLGLSGTVHARACHVGNLEEIPTLVQWTQDNVGMADVLVNNAATNPYFGPMMALEWGAWDKTFEVNLKGYFEMTRQVAQRLIAEGKPGSVISVSSVFGLTAAPFQGIYGMTKAAVVSLTKTLAFELGAANIRVNAICPGLVDTKLASAIVSNPALSKRFTERAALGRYAQPEEISGMVTYLASDEASYVTGQSFALDGGYTAY